VQAVKERQAKNASKAQAAKIKEARVSTADPDARVMRMSDGGFRPAFNVQLATDVKSGVIVGVAVTNSVADQGQALGMEQQVAKRTGRHPKGYLMDAGFINLEQITELKQNGIVIYAPPTAGQGAPKAKDSPEIANWRARMSTEEGKEVYEHRFPTAELPNAQITARHGVRQFRIRGLSRTSSFMLLVVITHNLLRWMALT